MCFSGKPSMFDALGLGSCTAETNKNNLEFHFIISTKQANSLKNLIASYDFLDCFSIFIKTHLLIYICECLTSILPLFGSFQFFLRCEFFKCVMIYQIHS